MKTCPHCKKLKAESDFGKDKCTLSGRTVYCKQCNNEKSNIYQKSGQGRLTTRLRQKMDRINHPEITREKYKLLKRKYNKTAAGKYWNLRGQAKRSGTDFNITQEEFETWFNSQDRHCVYCAQELSFGKGGHGNAMDMLTIDRRDNLVGYFIGNIVLACRRCNTIKGGWFTFDQMIEIATKYLRR